MTDHQLTDFENWNKELTRLLKGCRSLQRALDIVEIKTPLTLCSSYDNNDVVMDHIDSSDPFIHEFAKAKLNAQMERAEHRLNRHLGRRPKLLTEDN